MATTKEQVLAAVDVSIAVCEAIRELGEAPAGPIYAALMHKTGIDYQGFESLVAMLGRAGLVTKRGDMLKWTGPSRLAGVRS